MLDGNTGEQPTALSPDEGKRKVAALLGTPETDHAKPAERDTPVAKEPEEVTEATAYEDTSSDDADDERTELPSGNAESDSPEPPQRYTLPDGSETTAEEAAAAVGIPVAEWLKGYWRQSNFTRKAQELAEKKKTFEASISEHRKREEQIAQQAQYFDQAMPVVMQIAQSRIPPAPDPKMLDTDIIGFMQAKEAHEAALREVQELQNLWDSRQQQTQQEQARVQRETFQSAQAELLRMMPELKDPAKVTALRTEIETALPKYGYTADDANHLMDPRQIAVLKDAIAYRKLIADKPKAIDKAKDAIPVQQPGKRSSPGEAQAKARHEQMAKLRKTGDRNVGQSLIRQLIERGG